MVFGAFNQESSPNLHRHQNNQKNQTTRCAKPAQAPKKTKKTKPQQLVRKHGHRFGIFSFFVFFWCVQVGDGCTLVSLVLLVPASVL